MDIAYTTDKECILFQTDADTSVSYYDKSLDVSMRFEEPGFVTVKIQTGPIPDLKGYVPFERHELKGFCKKKENKEFSLYEEYDIIGENEEKLILYIQIMDYRTQNHMHKTLDELFTYMPIVRFLASITIHTKK